MKTPIDLAFAKLRAGGVVVIPTDTVYGIACFPDRPEAVQKVFSLKGRREDKALPVLGASLTDLTSVAEFDRDALAVAERCWPGPLTLVLPRTETFSFDLGGTDAATIAVRVPESPVAIALLAETGPLAVTSANISGRSPAATVEQAREIFGEGVEVYLDGGSCDAPASTVVSLIEGMKVLRPGPISEQALRQIVTS